MFKIAGQNVEWTQPSISRNTHILFELKKEMLANAHNLGLCTGRNAREFSKSQAGRRNASEFSNSQDEWWGGPSPVPAGMPTELVYLQDGMLAKIQNR